MHGEIDPLNVTIGGLSGIRWYCSPHTYSFLHRPAPPTDRTAFQDFMASYQPSKTGKIDFVDAGSNI